MVPKRQRVGSTVTGIAADCLDWPHTQRPPRALEPIVRDIFANDRRVVTLADLDAWATGIPPQRIARLLRERGWLAPMRTRGAWRPPIWYTGNTAGFDELLARLRVRPDTPASIAGHSAMEVRQWLKRPTEPTIGMPPGALVPRCLQGYKLLRWAPRSPLDSVEGIPVWSPATLLAYMASWPTKFGFEDVSEWLDLVCEAVCWDGLMIELDGRPRSVWMKAAFVAWRAGCHQLSSQILGCAPDAGKGPYKFGIPTRRWGSRTYPEFDVVDYVFTRHWEDPDTHFRRWPRDTPSAATTPAPACG